MEFKDILNLRRSHRQYKNTPVSRDLILELIQSASMAPVSCNLQLTQYIILDDQDLILKLSKEVSYKFKYAPCCIVVLQDLQFSIERHSGIMSASMAAENILLCATGLGLSTCAMAGFSKDEKTKKILGVPDYMTISLLISVGYSDDGVYMAPIPRIPIEERFNFNAYKEFRPLNESPILSNQSITDIINYRSRIAPVYLDRFRLSSYNPLFYEDVFEFFLQNIFLK